MFKGKRIIAIVPARGGSKGILLKNLSTIKGKTLIHRVANIIAEINEIDRAIISSDHSRIIKEGEAFGLDAPFVRPNKLSGDFVGDVDVLQHALLITEEIDRIQYDIILMLQPTSPFRKAEHIYQVLDKMIERQFDSVWTLSLTDKKYHPLKQLEYREGHISYYNRAGAKIIARQQLSNTYHRNGIAYAISRKTLINNNSILGEKAGGLVIDGLVVNIDTQDDLDLSELYIQQMPDN